MCYIFHQFQFSQRIISMNPIISHKKNWKHNVSRSAITFAKGIKFWRDKLSHLHSKSVFILAKLGVLLERFLYLKDNVPLCASFVFLTERRWKCRTKVNKLGSIPKYTNNKPGDVVSVDQLQSAQSGLIPQLSVKIINALIWSTQVMVDHFSDLTYVRLMRSTIQEDT